MEKKQKPIKDFSQLGKMYGIKDEKQHNNTGNSGSINNPNMGWLFYKDYYHGLPEIKDKNQRRVNWLEDGKAKELEEYFTIKNENIKQIKPVLNKKESIGNEQFELKTTYPGLVTGIGLIHETGLLGEAKLGFQFDYTTGLPYIPGSSVKGLLRSAFPHSLQSNKTDGKTLKKIDEYRKTRILYIKDLFSKLKDKGNNDISISLSDEEIITLEYAVFAGTDSKKTALEHSKRDIFCDAEIIKAPGGLMDIDYITPHKDPLKDPNPIKFFKILPEVVFRFSFILNDTILTGSNAYTKKGFEQLKDSKNIKGTEKVKIITTEMKRTLFKQILLDFGIGAKTNVGYGQFSESE